MNINEHEKKLFMQDQVTNLNQSSQIKIPPFHPLVMLVLYFHRYGETLSASADPRFLDGGGGGRDFANTEQLSHA